MPAAVGFPAPSTSICIPLIVAPAGIDKELNCDTVKSPTDI